jgi:hypothetical protein
VQPPKPCASAVTAGTIGERCSPSALTQRAKFCTKLSFLAARAIVLGVHASRAAILPNADSAKAAVGTQSSPSLGTSRAAFRLSGTSPRQGDCEFRRRRLFRVLASCMPRSGRPSPRRFFKAPCGAGKPKVSALEEARCPARRRRATYLFRQLLWCDAAIQSLSESPAPGRISRQITRRAGNPLPWLHCARALTPLRLAEIALPRIGPSAPIVIKDFAEFVEHFSFNPDTPAGKSFACGSGRAFLFPSSTHRGNFEQVRPLTFRFRHNLECY